MQQQLFNFMGLREDPFHVSPDPRFFYSTPAHESALVELLFGIETRKGFMVLTGEAGTGKTTLLNQIIDWLHRRRLSSAYVFHARLEPIGLLRFILKAFGVPCDSKSKSELVNALYTWLLQRHAARDFPVLILDEAQALPLQTLEELRLLLNLETPRGKLLQIILAGQPELEEKLGLPALRQLRQRIMFHSRLPRLSETQTTAYITSRLAAAGCADTSLFPEDVIQDIHECSRGIPRVVNLLCEHALISAYSEQQHVVAPEMILQIAADFDLCANPLAIGDSQFHSRYSPLVEFPFGEKITQAAADFRASIKEGHGFALPEAVPESVAQPLAQAVAQPVAQSAPKESSMPEVRPTRVESFEEAPKVYRYRRWGKRRTPAAVFARNFAVSLHSAWYAFTDTLDSYLHTVARSLSRKSSEPAPRPAVAATVTESSNIPQPFYRRRRRSPFSAITRNIAGFARNFGAFAGNSAASMQRTWHSVTDPVVAYVRSVTRSLVNDCRPFSRALTMPSPALEHGTSANGSGAAQKSPVPRDLLAPIINWLRQPVALSNFFGQRSPSRPAHRK